ncbi:IQCJ-SCHIP1 readthrough transcript protein isoform X3 [Ixodes scapularis]|uniref:IQCJ-SCHIP1 readthrough transcript protein isoform X3 n=1 Tax=Ixodes scapularis TaxID=6945 RepID=UPI001C38B8BE|nr:IQCJ-SCHIP1 readthrough transcript protein isoform X3 [Ixodes scapularis]
MADPLGALWESAGSYAYSLHELATMRLKLNVPLPEEKCLLHSRHVSPGFEDRLRSYRGTSDKTAPFPFRPAWAPERLSPEGAMSLSSPEPDDRQDTLSLLRSNSYGSDDSSTSSDEESSEMSQTTENGSPEANNNNLVESRIDFVTARPVSPQLANVLSLNVGPSPSLDATSDLVNVWAPGSLVDLSTGNRTETKILNTADARNLNLDDEAVRNACRRRLEEEEEARWPDQVAQIFDKAELTREATTSAASLLNFTPEKVRRSRFPEGRRRTASPQRDFDVYNIETTMPTIDWDAMETQLARAAKEADWIARRRHDREEIRRKLAMDTDVEEVERRKPSLTSRLQGSKSLQVCFMNQTLEDPREQEEDQQQQQPSPPPPPPAAPLQTTVVEASAPGPARRPSLLFGRRRVCRQPPEGEEAFSVRQARLQAEARMALAQAKEMARMQMEVERQQRKKSPIAEIVGIAFPDGRHRLSRQMLTDMNVAQLQVIVNDLHSQIESHNEDLVRFLLERDDLHMEQDSMLVDIEDMTRYLGAKNSQENTGVSSIQPEAK